MGLITKLFGTYSERELKSIYPIVDKIEAMADEYRALTDEELRAFIADALEKRAPFYVQARYRFDAGHLESRRQIAGSVQQLRSLLGI